ncbi:MAG: hypothetical protein ABWY25_09650 [Paenisporosarcina sp.]
MEYQSNSNKNKDEPLIPEKKVEKIVTGEAIQRSKPVGRKFKEVFFGGDFKYASRFVVADVILPRLRDLLVDIAWKGTSRLVYGESDHRRRHPEFESRTQYNVPVNRASTAFFRTPDPRERPYIPDQPHPYRRPVRRDYKEVVLADRAEAERVVERMYDLLEKYEIVTLADLYDLCGFATSHIDNKWGWTSLTNAQVVQVREGYLIDLPAAEAI